GRLSRPPLGLAHVRGMLAVDPPSEELGDAQPVVDRRARELLAVPGVGLREAVRPMADWVDEARHPTPIISGLRSWDQRACGRRGVNADARDWPHRPEPKDADLRPCRGIAPLARRATARDARDISARSGPLGRRRLTSPGRTRS